MPLEQSNTYIEPTAGTSVATARVYQNSNFRSLLTNFRSPAIPTTVNLRASGSDIGVQDGMLYWSSLTNALYVADSIMVKNSRVGGNFTRAGIGHRIENSIVALAANAATYEIGELVATVSANPSLSSNARLYLCMANTGTIDDFVDVGGSTTGFEVDANSNVTITGPSLRAPTILATSNVGIKTTSPTKELHVVGNVLITQDLFVNKIANTSYSGTSVIFKGANTISMETSGSARLTIVSNGNVGIKSTSPTNELYVTGNATVTGWIATGNVYISTIRVTYGTTLLGTLALTGNATMNSNLSVLGTTYLRETSVTGNVVASQNISAYSDLRLKSNIITISNALSMVNNMRGVRFTKDEQNRVGVIAQEMELILPEVVHDFDYKAVSYGDIVAVLIEAIKEQQLQINELKGLK